MFQIHDLPMRPVKMIGDVGYLLVQPLEGVARYSPAGSTSSVKLCSHLGQTAVIELVPSSLMRW